MGMEFSVGVGRLDSVFGMFPYERVQRSAPKVLDARIVARQNAHLTV